jgi:hypothetical protein
MGRVMERFFLGWASRFLPMIDGFDKLAGCYWEGRSGKAFSLGNLVQLRLALDKSV